MTTTDGGNAGNAGAIPGRPVIKIRDSKQLAIPKARPTRWNRSAHCTISKQTSAKKELGRENKRLHRLTHSKPRVELFFAWIDDHFARHGLLPSNPFTKALGYTRTARQGLEVFLTDPDVPMDTNHIERALRVIPMGRNYAQFVIMRSWRKMRVDLGLRQPTPLCRYLQHRTASAVMDGVAFSLE